MLDIGGIRSGFPALTRTHRGTPVAYLDGPAGTQVPESVVDAMARVHRDGIANLGGGFAASVLAEEVTARARSAMADYMGGSPSEIVFGQNMTSLTFAMSRSIARTWQPGDRIVITALDHAANRDPWTLAAADAGVNVDDVPFDPATGALDPDRVVGAIGARTRLVAVTAASNAVGSVTDLGPIVAAAREVGALVYVDGVHYSAHRLPDVRRLDVDFFVASAYKFSGPHTGVLWAREQHLERLVPYKVRPAPDSGPGRWETGTQAFESLAGVTAAVEHFADLGTGERRRERLETAFERIADHEAALAERFMAGVAENPSVTLHGPGAGGPDRVSTFAITVDGLSPGQVAADLADRGIHTWSGHYYAEEVMKGLGLADTGGAVRIGFVHYTSSGEVDRVLSALDDIS